MFSRKNEVITKNAIPTSNVGSSISSPLKTPMKPVTIIRIEIPKMGIKTSSRMKVASVKGIRLIGVSVLIGCSILISKTMTSFLWAREASHTHKSVKFVIRNWELVII